MKLPNNSDVDQCDQPEKSGEARSRGKRVKKKKKKKKGHGLPSIQGLAFKEQQQNQVSKSLA